ncbi:hypothetical protein GCM10010339_05840 [Streptomyces alanosinicus]|uniref:Cation-translocating P-type ATPase n=1 Tax=Streptomyces alanosinicus TaxID=68171 RepID=A0A919CZT9_9ACTN|nr:hypothetical protein GCM10010339_05840 [Streptomyces alanosinicus]
MILRSLARLPAAGVGLALGTPAQVARQVLPTIGAAVRGAAGTAETGVRTAVRGAAAVSTTAVRVGRVGLNAVSPGHPYWQAGSRVQLPLRPRAGVTAGSVESGAGRVAAALAKRPDVLAAYWDGGLARLVVQMTQDAVTDRVVDRATELAAQQKLERPDEDVLEPAHPGHTGGIRSGALALVCDAVGATTAVAARTVRLTTTPHLVSAGVTLLREDPRVRVALRRHLGRSATDLVLAAANAAAQGIEQAPTALLLDVALRFGQLTEAIARAAAFDAVHDTLCAPDRLSLAGKQVARPPIHRYPAQEYRDQAITGTLFGAAGALLFTGDVHEAAEALLAGNPKAARFGPAAFAAALGTELAREGVLVRNLDRLRQLELIDTVVLHPQALRSSRRTVLDVNANVSDWDHDRLWQTATAALGPNGPIELRPVPDQGQSEDIGLMIASEGGRDIGTVLVGWELDPLAEAALDAARRAGLHVVVVDDGTLGDFGGLADELVGGDRPLAEVVRGLQRGGRIVLTVAHVPAGGASTGQQPSPEGREVLAGLLRSDIAVSLTDESSAVVWGADVLLLQGLAGAWRLLAAIPAARAVGEHSKIFAEAGAALAGLLVVTRGRSVETPRPPARLPARPGERGRCRVTRLGLARRAARQYRSHPTPPASGAVACPAAAGGTGPAAGESPGGRAGRSDRCAQDHRPGRTSPGVRADASDGPSGRRGARRTARSADAIASRGSDRVRAPGVHRGRAVGGRRDGHERSGRRGAALAGGTGTVRSQAGAAPTGAPGGRLRQGRDEHRGRRATGAG